MKVCSKCSLTKSLEDFHRNKRRKDGYVAWCKDCCASYQKTYRKENEEDIRRSKQEYHVENRAKIIAKATLWKKSNKHVTNSITARRRASKRKATPPWEVNERAKIKGLYRLARLVSELTEVRHEVDHIVPLMGGDSVQGLHCFSNLRIIPGVDNAGKGNKWWPDMW